MHSHISKSRNEKSIVMNKIIHLIYFADNTRTIGVTTTKRLNMSTVWMSLQFCYHTIHFMLKRIGCAFSKLINKIVANALELTISTGRNLILESIIVNADFCFCFRYFPRNGFTLFKFSLAFVKTFHKFIIILR